MSIEEPRTRHLLHSEHVTQRGRIHYQLCMLSGGRTVMSPVCHRARLSMLTAARLEQDCFFASRYDADIQTLLRLPINDSRYPLAPLRDFSVVRAVPTLTWVGRP
jgi:hypothetical protein